MRKIKIQSIAISSLNFNREIHIFVMFACEIHRFAHGYD